ncbi:hypothetical protein GF378_02445 [Candidatus Pacearchaeota archaeon]|nr:hypothetical protein [Candidatus Pacearchaeota archaeon]
MVSRIKSCSYFLDKYPILRDNYFCGKFPHIVLATSIIHALNELHKEVNNLEILNNKKTENCQEIFPEFKKIGVGKSI